MKLSVGVMAHKRREHFVRELLPNLPGADVTWDRHEDVWDTGRRALLAGDKTADWRLVIQDDALPCKDFLAGVAQALGHAHRGPVSFYLGEAMADTLGAPESGWLQAPGPWGGVAIALPTADIPTLVKWADGQGVASYDKGISRWYGVRGIQCLYSVPSLVDHRESPSLMPVGRRMERRGTRRSGAYRFVGLERSALDVGWEPC